jgi:lysophospholipid acyltransferase (LPLAT)-like uncharacterized protein
MAEKPKNSEPEVPFKARVTGFLVSLIIRSVCLTLRWELQDKAGFAKKPPENPVIWTFWHNRIFTIPVMYRKYLRHRSGAILTSQSKDGAIIATSIKCFGVDAVRGSSSRGGLRALLSLKKWLSNGFDVAITPDGPRGPRYQLAPGVIILAQKTGAGILPIRAKYSSFWRLNSWDQFQIPRPFSKVTIILEPVTTIPPDLDEDNFESERLRVEKIMNPDKETE